MSEIKNGKFLILSKAEELVFDIDDILENVPRKDIYYKDKLKEPAIIDFGDGHSIYKTPLMFYEFQRLIKKLIKNIPN